MELKRKRQMMFRFSSGDAIGHAEPGYDGKARSL